MALLAWFDTKEYFDTSAKAALAEEAPCGLTLQQVLSAHIVWHEKFIEVMHGAKDADFELTKVYQNHHSVFGKWLDGEAKTRFGHLPEYNTLCKAHTAFHGFAGVTLGQHQMGNEEYAQQMLKTSYRTAFNQVKIRLNHLFSVASFKHSIRQQSVSVAA